MKRIITYVLLFVLGAVSFYVYYEVSLKKNVWDMAISYSDYKYVSYEADTAYKAYVSDSKIEYKADKIKHFIAFVEDNFHKNNDTIDENVLVYNTDYVVNLVRLYLIYNNAPEDSGEDYLDKAFNFVSTGKVVARMSQKVKSKNDLIAYVENL